MFIVLCIIIPVTITLRIDAALIHSQILKTAALQTEKAVNKNSIQLRKYIHFNNIISECYILMPTNRSLAVLKYIFVYLNQLSNEVDDY